MNELVNKTVLITGSTSGIGYGIAKQFAILKTKIIINGFATENEIKKISSELREGGAQNVLYHNADLSKPDEIKNLALKVKECFGSIDVLINNAGVQYVAPIDEFPEDEWEKIIRVDLIAAFYMIKAFVSDMKKNNFGRIINIGSAHSLVASKFKSAYVAAKHGLVGLTKTVALEVAEHNITVNAICPGYVKTPLVLDQIKATASARGITQDDVIKNVILAAQATKEFVDIEEIASLAIYLCSHQARSITGAALSIDGGWTAG